MLCVYNTAFEFVPVHNAKIAHVIIIKDLIILYQEFYCLFPIALYTSIAVYHTKMSIYLQSGLVLLCHNIMDVMYRFAWKKIHTVVSQSVSYRYNFHRLSRFDQNMVNLAVLSANFPYVDI